MQATPGTITCLEVYECTLIYSYSVRIRLNTTVGYTLNTTVDYALNATVDYTLIPTCKYSSQSPALALDASPERRAKSLIHRVNTYFVKSEQDLCGTAAGPSRLRRTVASTRPPTEDVTEPRADSSATTIPSCSILRAGIGTAASSVVTLATSLFTETAQGAYAILGRGVGM